MNHFRPCVNRTACTEDGSHCRSCGRPHEEINRVRQVTGDVAAFLKEMQYDNPDEFMDYLQRKVMKKIKKND